MLFLRLKIPAILVQNLLVVSTETELVDAQLVDVAFLVHNHVLDVDQLLKDLVVQSALLKRLAGGAGGLVNGGVLQQQGLFKFLHLHLWGF